MTGYIAGSAPAGIPSTPVNLIQMATTSDIKNGLCIRHQNGLYQILEFLHKKTARGSGNVWTKLKNLENGKIIEHSFNTGSKIDVIRVETREYTYLYEDDMVQLHELRDV